MGTKLINNPQLSLITGKQCAPVPVWYDDGLAVKERISIATIMSYLDQRGAHPEYFEGTAEPGYGDGPAIAADWNKVPKQFAPWLEDVMAITLLWSDEWAQCEQCGKAARTTSDGYEWAPYFIRFDDCSLTCLSCVEENWDEWKDEVIDLYAEDVGYPPPQSKALPQALVNYLPQEGYVCLDDENTEACKIFESGFYPDQTGTPEKVHAALKNEFPDAKIIFTLGSVGTFSLSFNVWLKYDNEVTE